MSWEIQSEYSCISQNLWKNNNYRAHIRVLVLFYSLRVQYNSSGGYRLEGSDNRPRRWQWNTGGQRMVLKLNRYLALKIMDCTKIYLVFYGNKRGVRLNVGLGRQVNLMSVACDSSKRIAKDSQLEEKESPCGSFDFARGSYNTPTLGFLNNERGRNNVTRCPSTEDISPGFQCVCSFTDCNFNSDMGAGLSNDYYTEGCEHH